MRRMKTVPKKPRAVAQSDGRRAVVAPGPLVSGLTANKCEICYAASGGFFIVHRFNSSKQTPIMFPNCYHSAASKGGAQTVHGTEACSIRYLIGKE